VIISGTHAPDREVRVFLGLGSNLGDRLVHLADAVRFISRDKDLRLERVSSVYETAPVGPIEQPPYLNAVLVLSTRLSPRALLERVKDYERQAGRVPGERWGPRTIDLDILLYGCDEVSEPGLHIPHPELERRAFVLVPLAELEPELVLAGTGERVVDVASRAVVGAGVARIDAALAVGERSG
jgi:2-amino-4-hydroxy-6-hydroxymethyldihydropteridine diphosphokinase